MPFNSQQMCPFCHKKVWPTSVSKPALHGPHPASGPPDPDPVGDYSHSYCPLCLSVWAPDFPVQNWPPPGWSWAASKAEAEAACAKAKAEAVGKGLWPPKGMKCVHGVYLKGLG